MQTDASRSVSQNYDHTRPMSQQNRLSIVVPTLNEERNISELVRRIDAALALAGTEYEVIFVDDHSADGTLAVVENMATEYPVRSFVKKGEKGKAYSLLEGFEYARYELVAILDADLQYPPETLPAMLKHIEDGMDVVVARRIEQEIGMVRKILSRGFALVFSKMLHGLDCDVQAGMKVFRKKILDEVKLEPSPWTFDLEFLLGSRNYGYAIGNVDMPFAERSEGESKVVLWKAMYEIGWNAVQLKFKKWDDVRISPNGEGVMAGAGVANGGSRFITHTTLGSDISAFETFVPWQKRFLTALLILTIIGLAFYPLATGVTIVALLTLAYFADMVLGLFLAIKSLNKPPEIVSTPEELALLDESQLPMYSILCPLYKESQVLPMFLKSIGKLEWPKDKLDVLLLLEENDRETIDAALNMDMPDCVRVVIVLDSKPKTKPKACNYGISFARGEYAVVYDAEDVPDPLQLKKAYLGFQKVPESVRCLQAKLNYFNPEQNILTRLFTAEYSLWFDIILPGLQSLDTALPLGGTSNHFRTQDILECEGWDPFNVTEDCDLGVRMFKRGYRTAIIDSVTLEEANSSVKNWIRQRSRWMKGYMQTYLVHMREPAKFFREHGLHAVLFQLMIGLRLVFILINPLLWLVTILYFTLRDSLGQSIEALYPSGIFYFATTSMIFGNFLAMYYYMVGCAKREYWSLIKYVFFVPFYWLLGSMAAVMAAYQLFTNPHYWEKTNHGLHLQEGGLLRWWKGVSERFCFKRPEIVRPVAALSPVESVVTTAEGTAAIAGMGGFLARWKRKSKRKEDTVAKVEGLRILIFNWRDMKHSSAGGAEVYAHEMAREWVATGNQVTLFCAREKGALLEETIDGIRVVRRGGFYSVYLWAWVTYMLHFRGRYDVVVDCQNGIPFFTPLYAKEPVYCLMHHVHQKVFFYSLSKPLALLASFLEKTVMPIVYRRSGFVTVSDSSRKEIESLGMGKLGIAVVHPGLHMRRLERGKKSLHPTVLYLGRLKAYKSVDVLIRAFVSVLRSRPESMLIIAGDGDEQDRLRKLSGRLGLDDRHVLFLGKVSEEVKLKLLRTAWVLVNPSLMEGWGMVAIEANACGTPVIASDVPGLRDSVNNPHTGRLVRYGDVDAFARSMLELFENESLRKEMSKNAVAWAKHFDWRLSSRKFFRQLKLSGDQ